MSRVSTRVSRGCYEKTAPVEFSFTPLNSLKGEGTVVALPFRERRLGVVKDSIPSLEPDEVLGRFTPELLRLVDAASMYGVVQTTIRSCHTYTPQY